MRSSGSRAERRREKRWPPLNSITQEGRLAALVTTGCLIASGIVWTGFSVRVLVFTDAYSVKSAAGGLLAILLSVVVVVLVGSLGGSATGPWSRMAPRDGCTA